MEDLDTNKTEMGGIEGSLQALSSWRGEVSMRLGKLQKIWALG